jgi:hypothetical protein
MGELIGILQERVSHKSDRCSREDSPHLIDDFHRVLVEYVREGFPAKETQSKKYKVPLSLVLYEVTLPGAATGAA